jgi:hypothetical protein
MYYDNMNLVELVSLYYYIVNKDDEKILESAKEKLGDVDYTQLKLDKDTIVRKILVANCLDSVLEIIDFQMIFTKKISDGVFDFVEILVEIIEYGMMRGLMSEGCNCYTKKGPLLIKFSVEKGSTI